MRIMITNSHTFGVKRFHKVMTTREGLIVYNVFGFGLWIKKGGVRIDRQN